MADPHTYDMRHFPSRPGTRVPRHHVGGDDLYHRSLGSNRKRTEKYIKQAELAAEAVMASSSTPAVPQVLDVDGKKKKAGSYNVGVTFYAWIYLRGMRRLGDDRCKELNVIVPIVKTAPYDYALADAEHYMYARLLGATTGDPDTRDSVRSYQRVKEGLTAVGLEQKVLQTDARFPVLKPTVTSLSWGLRGADDGLEIYKYDHDGKLGQAGTCHAVQDMIEKKAKEFLGKAGDTLEKNTGYRVGM